VAGTDVDVASPVGHEPGRDGDETADTVPTARAASLSENRGLANRWLTNRWMWVGVISTLSALLHFWDLGRRPLAHDEAIDAWFSWNVRNFEVAEYDPVYHGPLRFYVEGLILRVFGPGIAEARYLAAAAGVIATAVIAASTRTLGRFGAPFAAVVFTISPTILTVTRTGREDSSVVLVSLGLLLLVAYALVAPRPAHIVGLGSLLAISFGLKETTFIFGLCTLLFLVAGLLAARHRPDSAAGRSTAALVALGREPYLWGLMAFAVVFAVIFTSGFRYTDGLASGMLDGITYWWSQHDVQRGGQPWFFYFVIYAAYEWLLIVAALAGAVVAWRRRSLVATWFAWMAVSQAILYAWAGEKFAWLAVHALVPTVLLAGVGADAVVRRLRRAGPASRIVTSALVAVALLVTTAIAIPPAITDGANPAELLVTVQTSDDVPPVAARLRAAYEAGEIESILIDDSGGGSWPWVWYLEGLPVSYQTVDQSQPLPDADAMILLAGEFPPEVDDGRTAERIRLRRWWVVDYDAMGLDDAVRWLTTRRTWNETGSSDQWVIMP
jgi:uncharacterized protein (TIGR03663 family)